MAKATETSWCILRTSGSNTLPLARGLQKAGFDAWTPIERRQARIGPSRDRVEREITVIPSYVFADARRLAELLKISKDPAQCYRRWDAEQRKMVMQGIPSFSVFRYNDRFPLIADESLEALRVIERRTAPKPEAPTYRTGDKVRIVEGSFAGLNGVVESSKGDYSLVCFPNYPIPIKIARLLLVSDVVSGTKPESGTAAQAA